MTENQLPNYRNRKLLRRGVSCANLLRLLGISLLFFSAQSVSASDAGIIKGTVKAEVGGQTNVVAAANLTLTNKSKPDQPIKTVSDAAGDFLFDNLPSGDYILTIEAANLTSVTKEIKLTSGANLVWK